MAFAGITLALAVTCAPSVAPDTLARVVKVESGGNPLALNVNHLAGRAQPKPTTAAEAARLAAAYIAKGYSVDMGLMQVNSGTLQRLDYTVADMFDPCTNLAAGAAILTENYTSAKSTREDPQKALRAALSAYNTGNFKAGFRNGYVRRYMAGPARITLPLGAAVTPAKADSAPPSGGDAAVALTRTPPPPDAQGEFSAIGEPSPNQSSTAVIAEWRRDQ
ncbi:MAG: lytic transglycosylase domain-containing protein [Paracoccaceae bacterium]|nr:lytic transglycosylase domain-containing protein [Paracoccaceae bacterium]